MRAIVEWLTGVERQAAEFYQEAAGRFAADGELSAFLRDLAEEEAWHLQLMQQAVPLLERSDDPDAVAIDPLLRERVEERLRHGREVLVGGGLDRAELFELLAAVEFSEWNDLFLYVIQALRGCGREFEQAAAELLRHKEEIESFLERTPEGLGPLATLHSLPPVWDRRILVVEDEAPLALLLRELLASVGAVEIARDGAEGLERLRHGYYDAIVTDIDMPVMDGIALYRQACREEPEVAGRFLFYSAACRSEVETFFRDTPVARLTKPASIPRLRQAVAEITRSGRAARVTV